MLESEVNPSPARCAVNRKGVRPVDPCGTFPGRCESGKRGRVLSLQHGAAEIVVNIGETTDSQNCRRPISPAHVLTAKILGSRWSLVEAPNGRSQSAPDLSQLLSA